MPYAKRFVTSLLKNSLFKFSDQLVQVDLGFLKWLILNMFLSMNILGKIYVFKNNWFNFRLSLGRENSEQINQLELVSFPEVFYFFPLCKYFFKFQIRCFLISLVQRCGIHLTILTRIALQ